MTAASSSEGIAPCLLSFGILSKIRSGGRSAGEAGSLVLPIGALDCSFAIVVLRRRVPEKVGTNTYLTLGACACGRRSIDVERPSCWV